MKHILNEKYYLRYCDDFIILSDNYEHLKKLIKMIDIFLQDKLKLRLHENKVSIRKLKQGIDFVGYVILPHHRRLRTKTKRRMLKRVNQNNLPSYLGLLKYCNSYKLSDRLLEKQKAGKKRMKMVGSVEIPQEAFMALLKR